MKNWIIAIMIALSGCNDATPAYYTDCNDEWNDAYDIAVIDMQSLIADRDAQIKDLQSLLEEEKLNNDRIVSMRDDHIFDLYSQIRQIEEECRNEF